MFTMSFGITLRVGIYDDYPLCYVENGKPKGLYVVVLGEVAKKEGWKIEYTYGKWEDLLSKLESGEIDALAAIAYTPERAQRFLFNEEPFISNWGVVVAKKILHEIFDLKGMKIALVKKDVYAERFLKIAKNFRVKLGDITWVYTYDEALKALNDGRVDAAVVSRIAAVTRSDVYRYKVSPIIFSPVDLKMAFSRSTPFVENIVVTLDRHLRLLKSDPNSVYWRFLNEHLFIRGYFDWMKFLVGIIALLLVAFLVALGLYVQLRKRTKQLRKLNTELSSMNNQVEAMNRQIKDLYEELQRSFERFQEVVELASQVTTFTINDEDFFRKILLLALKLVPKAKYGSISFLEGDRWKYVATVGHDIEILKKLDLKREYAMVNLKKAIIVDHIMEKDKGRIPPETLEKMIKATRPIKSSIVAPIKLGGSLVGFFTLDIPEWSDESFDRNDLEIVDRFARITSGFYAARRYLQMEGKFHKGVVLALVKALEYYDPYTRGHSERVARLAAELAEIAGLPKETIKKIYWAALVHDIGKIYIPQSILNKPGKLTDDEYEKVKIHPVKGYEILKETEGLEEIAVIVLYHHERCDGTGYPKGLKCDEIPIESRIIAIADAFDAMTSARAYRDPLTVDEAIVELLKGAGTQFDAELVRVFVAMIREQEKGGRKRD